MNKILRFTGIFSIFVILFAVAGCETSTPGTAQESRAEIASEIENELENLVNVWYPRVIDEEEGGYLSRFTYNWQMEGSQDKMIVTQSRHLWTLSKIGEKNPSNQNYAEYASHGFQFLQNEMWDDEYGGFFELVTRQGEPVQISNSEIEKTLYGNAFALYSLSAYFKFSERPEVLDLAKETFQWLETHSHDPVHGGYFQPLSREGTPYTTGHPKDYNSGIHILEALTELYAVWPDDLVRERLEEMFYIVRDTMITDKGYLNLYFSAGWKQLSYRDSSRSVLMENIWDDHVTPGHDIETAYLLLEAAHVLGIDKDEKTNQIAKKLTDHTLEIAWDQNAGGIYDMGYYFAGDDQLTLIEETKNWWAQAEALNTLLIMSDLYPDDPQNYFEKFAKQWEYIQQNLIDHEHGGWYDSGLDKEPESRTHLKAQIWKGNYHTVRSLMNCLHRLTESNVHDE